MTAEIPVVDKDQAAWLVTHPQPVTTLQKMTKRSLHHTLAKQLVVLYWHHKHHPEVEWVHAGDLFMSQKVEPRSDFSKLQYWGLIERNKAPRKDRNPFSGCYKITEFGVAFVEKKVTVWKHVLTINGRGGVVAYVDDGVVTIDEALYTPFNYELLTAPPDQLLTDVTDEERRSYKP